MEKIIFEIESNLPLTESVCEMRLRGERSGIQRAGQFVNIALEGHFLRRPISVCDFTAETLTLVYKVVGEGTAQMAKMRAGERLDVLTGLGNGFSVERECRKPLLVGGGVGTPPLYRLAKDLLERECSVSVVLGFNSANEVFYADRFRALGANVVIATADGSVGVRGFVTDAIREQHTEYDYFYACGPVPMLKALCKECPTDGELSFEERMGCGFGACMGCSCKTLTGNKRICKEGPVLLKNEIIR